MPEYTIYPNAHPETTSVDGHTERSEPDIENGNTWAGVHDGVGTAATDSQGTAQVRIASAGTAFDKWQRITRTILLFDTSSIPAGLIAAGATLWVYRTSTTNGLDTSSFSVNVYASTPASNTAIAASDYANFGTTSFSTAISMTPLFDTQGWMEFPLNATGLAAITVGQIAKLALRESLHDVANSAPTYIQNKQFLLTIATADNVDSSLRPKLVVTAVDTLRQPRVTAIVDYFSSGWGNRPPSYKMELSLGGLSSIYASPMPDREPPPTIPTMKPAPEPPRLYYDIWITQTKPEVILGLFKGHYPSFAEWAAWWKVYGQTTQLW